MMGGGAGGDVPGNAQSWIVQGMKIAGASGADLGVRPRHHRHARERRERERGQQLGQQCRAGTPSAGSLQFIEPTFAQYAMPGYTQWMNPVDQVIAASWKRLRRQPVRVESTNVPGVKSVRQGGSYVGYDNGGAPARHDDGGQPDRQAGNRTHRGRLRHAQGAGPPSRPRAGAPRGERRQSPKFGTGRKCQTRRRSRRWTGISHSCSAARCRICLSDFCPGRGKIPTPKSTASRAGERAYRRERVIICGSSGAVLRKWSPRAPVTRPPRRRRRPPPSSAAAAPPPAAAAPGAFLR